MTPLSKNDTYLTMAKWLFFLKKIVIGYCIFLILYQFWEIIQFRIYEEILVDCFIKISIYLTLISILTIRKKGMWFVGLLFFCLGTYDLFYRDILTGVPREISSGFAYFDFSYPFYNMPIFYGKSLIKHFLKITICFIFPITTILFFTNFIRQYFRTTKKHPPQ